MKNLRSIAGRSTAEIKGHSPDYDLQMSVGESLKRTDH